MNDVLENELYHHGIKGQRWGYRRWQNFDGSYTPSGRIHYGVGEARRYASNFGKSISKSGFSFTKSIGNAKINALDYANRKGILDFLDSKADAPFKAIREVNVGYTAKSARNPLDFLKKTDAIDSMIPHNSKSGEIDTYIPMVERGKSNSRFSKAVDYASNKFDPYEWGKASIKVLGQSVEDKKLGMISKDVRDIERSVAGKEFIEKLKSDNSLASKLSSTFYNTDYRGYQPSFKGNMYETETMKRATDFMFKPQYDDKGKEVGGSMVATKYETVKVADISKPTKDFLSYRASLNLPSNYSNVAKEYTEIHSSNAYDILKNTSFKHSDLDDFLMHHGIKGQRWGNRRYQNNDGSLTALGRVHYGVGAAKTGLGKAASSVGGVAKKAGGAVRKAVKPTDEELLQKYDKAQTKQARRELKSEINEMNGRKKKLKDMSDQEVINAINRYRNEATLKQLAKEANKSPLRRAIDESARNAIAKAAGTTMQKVLENVGANVANAFDTKENKIHRQAQMVEDQKKIDKANKGKSDSERLKEYSENSKASREAYESQLQEAALRGDETAKQRLSDYKKAVTGRHENARDDPSYVDLDKDSASYEVPKESSKRQNYKNVSDVYKKAGSNEYEEAVTDVDVEYVNDYVRTKSNKTIKSIVPVGR